MKKEATLGTTVKWRENGLYAPVAFCVIRNLISKLQIMLVTEVLDFCSYLNSVLPHNGFFLLCKFLSQRIDGALDLQILTRWTAPLQVPANLCTPYYRGA